MSNSFAKPPRVAAFQHRGARSGFEVVFLKADGDHLLVEGHTAAVEEGEAWAVDYAIVLNRSWLTRSAQVHTRNAAGRRTVTLDAHGAGEWTVNGAQAPQLDGCLDVDLEASSFTNAFPVHRLGLEIGEHADAAAAYVRVMDDSVERLEQQYLRRPNDGDRRRYHYKSPAFGFEADLVYDESGIVIDYPGIAVRAA
jgi:hypothetical protein